MAQQVLEGTWEEIRAHDAELAGRHVRVIVMESQEPQSQSVGQPRYTADEVRQRLREMNPEYWVDPASLSVADKQEIMRQIAEIQRGMNPKRGPNAVALVREARSGAMYRYEPCE